MNGVSMNSTAALVAEARDFTAVFDLLAIAADATRAKKVLTELRDATAAHQAASEAAKKDTEAAAS
jgi:hypothetical protein